MGAAAVPVAGPARRTRPSFDLLAAYEGSALLANTMHDPEILSGAARRIDHWIDTL